jgi:hypothetical protein
MSAAVLAMLTLLPGDIVVGDRQPAAAYVFAQGGTAVGLVSEVLRAAAAVVERRTNLVLLSPEQAGWDAELAAGCSSKNRLSCWARSVRADSEPRPKYLLVVGILPQDERSESITSLLIDLEKARRAMQEIDRSTPSGEEMMEKRIYTESAQAAPAAVNARDRAELERYFEGVITVDFRRLLSSTGNLDLLGEIDLESPGEGWVVELDGKSIGATHAGHTRITELAPKTHSLAVIDPSGLHPRYETTLQIGAGRTANVVVSNTGLQPGSARSIARTAVFWGGAVTAVGGAVLVGASALIPRSTEQIVACSGTGCSQTPHSSLVSFCELGSASASCFSGRSRITPAALGLSLLALGGVSAVGTELIADDEAPWIPLAAGLGAGVLTMALFAILNPDPRVNAR